MGFRSGELGVFRPTGYGLGAGNDWDWEREGVC